jgi:hypothetical protein
MAEPRLRLREEDRHLIGVKGTRYNTVYKKRAIRGVLRGKVLFDNRYVAERVMDSYGTCSELSAGSPEKLAEYIVKSDKGKEGKAPDYNFQFDVFTNPESVNPRYRLDEPECRRFLDAVSKAKK